LRASKSVRRRDAERHATARRAGRRRVPCEEEEHEFWSSHELTDEFFDAAEPIDESELPRPRKHLLSVRIEDELVRRLKALAAVKGVGYQTLLRQFVAERVYEEEKREGILK
jgi:predicted DNA binding CopG/RHH family protein